MLMIMLCRISPVRASRVGEVASEAPGVIGVLGASAIAEPQVVVRVSTGGMNAPW